MMATAEHQCRCSRASSDSCFISLLGGLAWRTEAEGYLTLCDHPAHEFIESGNDWYHRCLHAQILPTQKSRLSAIISRFGNSNIYSLYGFGLCIVTCLKDGRSKLCGLRLEAEWRGRMATAYQYALWGRVIVVSIRDTLARTSVPCGARAMYLSTAHP